MTVSLSQGPEGPPGFPGSPGDPGPKGEKVGCKVNSLNKSQMKSNIVKVECVKQELS